MECWYVDNTPNKNFYIDSLNETIDNHGTPVLSSIEQSRQFTSEWFTGALKHYNTHITLEGKDHWIDNVFVERRSEKCEEIYLKVNLSIDVERDISDRHVHSTCNIPTSAASQAGTGQCVI